MKGLRCVRELFTLHIHVCNVYINTTDTAVHRLFTVSDDVKHVRLQRRLLCRCLCSDCAVLCFSNLLCVFLDGCGVRWGHRSTPTLMSKSSNSGCPCFGNSVRSSATTSLATPQTRCSNKRSRWSRKPHSEGRTLCCSRTGSSSSKERRCNARDVVCV